MRLIAGVTLVAVLAFAPQAFALSGNGGKGGAVSGNFNGFNYSGSCDSSNNCSGTFSNGNQGGSWSGRYVSTPEPLATLLVGLGLLGVRFLRRR